MNTTNKPESFGSYLKRKRFGLAAEKAGKVTQSDMVHYLKALNPALAVTAATLFCWETDKRTPHKRIEKAIRDALGA